MKAIVLLNCTAKQVAAMTGKDDASRIADAFIAYGMESDVRFVRPDTLASEASSAVKAAQAGKADLVVAGGGDGTVGTVAAALADSEIPLGILPLGTLNRFAKDVGIGLDVATAIGVIAGGYTGRIDLGEINGRVFVNNSSLGIYPRIVMGRDAWRKRYGLGKWSAMSIAMLKTFRRFPLVRLRLKTDDDTLIRTTPFVFIGNNAYQFDLLNVGQRQNLDAGQLGLYVANARTRWGMFKLTLRGLFGMLEQARDFDEFRVTECTIETRRHRIHVAADGEVMTMEPPLRYRIRPGALRLFLPDASTDSAARTEANMKENATPV